MPLLEHVRELRNRLVKGIGAILLVTTGAAFFYKQLIGFLIAPLPGCTPSQLAGAALAGHCGVVALNGLLSPFTLALKVSITAGVIAASPVWLYQLWAFIAPGLHRNEKKYTLAFLGAGIPLFLSGAALAYWLLPTTARMLISFTPAHTTNLLPVDDFLNLATRFIVVFGLSFELPLLLILLNAGGVISARRMIGWWRLMVLAITVFAALATPSTDPLTMLLLAAPLSLLYFAACAVAWAHDRRRVRHTHDGMNDTEVVSLELTPSQ